MANGQRMTVGDVVANTMDGRLEDFDRAAVALVARELMEGEISVEIGGRAGRSGRGCGPRSQWVQAACVGDEGRGDRVDDSEAAFGIVVLPVVLGAALVVGAGDRVGRAGGVRQRGEHASHSGASRVRWAPSTLTKAGASPRLGRGRSTLLLRVGDPPERRSAAELLAGDKPAAGASARPPAPGTRVHTEAPVCSRRITGR